MFPLHMLILTCHFPRQRSKINVYLFVVSGHAAETIYIPVSLWELDFWGVLSVLFAFLGGAS